MGSPPNQCIPKFDCYDVANCKQFMDALINFLNEASVCMREVRQRTGLSNDCSPVQMNEEEKCDKWSTILCNLNQTLQVEKSKSGTANQTPSAFIDEGSKRTKKKVKPPQTWYQPYDAPGGQEMYDYPVGQEFCTTPEMTQRPTPSPAGRGQVCPASLGQACPADRQSGTSGTVPVGRRLSEIFSYGGPPWEFSKYHDTYQQLPR